MPDYKHTAVIILVIGLVTAATRILPVLIFGRGEKVPDLILYLGDRHHSLHGSGAVYSLTKSGVE